MTTTTFTFLNGSIVTKAPINGITAVYNGGLQTLSSATPGTPWVASTAPPVTPMGICGSLANGVAIYGAAASGHGSAVYGLSGVGVSGASWNQMPALPATCTSVSGISGDLLNGLVVFCGKHVYALPFNVFPLEWVTMAQSPYNVTAIAGDPTNGVLIAVDPSGTGTGVSALYYGVGTCACTTWTPLSGTGTILPLARVKISSLCGSKTNGFVYYGENQLVWLALTVGTASPVTVTAVPTVLSALPFAVVDISGDATNGLSVIATANNGSTPTSGTLIATCPPVTASAPASAWTVAALQGT